MKRIHHALAEALGVPAKANLLLETVDVEGAAALLHCSKRAVYVRWQRGQLPKPLPGRRLIWRKSDLLGVGGV